MYVLPIDLHTVYYDNFQFLRVQFFQSIHNREKPRCVSVKTFWGNIQFYYFKKKTPNYVIECLSYFCLIFFKYIQTREYATTRGFAHGNS